MQMLRKEGLPVRQILVAQPLPAVRVGELREPACHQRCLVSRQRPRHMVSRCLPAQQRGQVPQQRWQTACTAQQTVLTWEHSGRKL